MYDLSSHIPFQCPLYSTYWYRYTQSAHYTNRQRKRARSLGPYESALYTKQKKKKTNRVFYMVLD